MLGRTHAITGVAAGLAAATVVGHVESVPVLAYGVAAMGALLPDLDQHASIASRYAVNKPLHMLLRHFRHRRFTHSLLGLAMFGVLVLLLWNGLNLLLNGGLSPWFGLMLLVGWGSHIMADMFNKQGVHLFYPFVFRKVEWISVPLPRALRISTIHDPKGSPLLPWRTLEHINTEKVFFRYPVYLLIAFVAWHQLDSMVLALRQDVWSGVHAMPSPVSDVLTGLLR